MKESQRREHSREASDAQARDNRGVAVCICTRNRPRQFARCLHWVLTQQLSGRDHGIDVVVVDNSVDGAERATVEAYAQRMLPVAYIHEPRPGIPFARNAALDAALGRFPSWIAFIDDDEVPPRGWLSRLLETAVRESADVVHGGAIRASAAEIENLAESWRPSDAAPRARRSTSAATNNVLFRTWIVADPVGLRFDEAMRDTGGSDGEFFMRAADAGAAIVRTADAPVFEEQGEEREAPSWLRRRSFRVGANCNYRYRKNRRPGVVAMALLLGRATESAGRASTRILLAALVVPVSPSRANALARRGVLDLCFAWGCLAPYFGVGPKAYY
jgi:glycosyltransferase involved in cell wall biosynthesis